MFEVEILGKMFKDCYAAVDRLVMSLTSGD